MVAASTLGLIKEPMILSNFCLLTTFHTWFVIVHFNWCQKRNPEAGDTPSFQAQHMLVRYFLMLQQVEYAMEEKWMVYAEFGGFVRSFKNLNESNIEIQKKK